MRLLGEGCRATSTERQEVLCVMLFVCNEGRMYMSNTPYKSFSPASCLQIIRIWFKS